MIQWNEVPAYPGQVSPKNVVFPGNCWEDEEKIKGQLRGMMESVQLEMAERFAENPEFVEMFFSRFDPGSDGSVLSQLRNLDIAKRELVVAAQRRIVYVKLAEFLREKEKFDALFHANPRKYQELWECEKKLFELRELEIGQLPRVSKAMEAVQKTVTAFMDNMTVPSSNELRGFMQFLCAPWRTPDQQAIIERRLRSTKTSLFAEMAHEILKDESQAGAWAKRIARATISDKLASWGNADFTKDADKVLTSMERVVYAEWFSDATWAQIDENIRNSASIAQNPTTFVQTLSRNRLLPHRLPTSSLSILISLLKSIIETSAGFSPRWSRRDWQTLAQRVADFGRLYSSLKTATFPLDDNVQMAFSSWKRLFFSIPVTDKTYPHVQVLQSAIASFHCDISSPGVAHLGQGSAEACTAELRQLRDSVSGANWSTISYAI